MIANIKEKVTHRCCPNCGYIVAQVEMQYFRFNYNCPRCGKCRMDSFQLIEKECKK